MTDAKTTVKPGRKARSLEEEIAKVRDKLKRLEEQQKEQQRKQRERNIKAVVELIRLEKLDVVSADRWKEALPDIRALLLRDEDASATPETRSTGSGNAKSAAPTERGQDRRTEQPAHEATT